MVDYYLVDGYFRPVLRFVAYAGMTQNPRVAPWACERHESGRRISYPAGTWYPNNRNIQVPLGRR